MVDTLTALSSEKTLSSMFLPNSIQPGTAPLLCAGITTYSPLRHWGVTKGKKVGVVGLGGLGHMAVKFAHALGAHVVVFTTSPNKKEDAVRLGADEVVVSHDAEEMKKHAGQLLTSSWMPCLLSMTSMHTSSSSDATATSRLSAHPPNLLPSLPLVLHTDVAVSLALQSEASQRLRKCSNFVTSITSLPMLKSFLFRR